MEGVTPKSESLNRKSQGSCLKRCVAGILLLTDFALAIWTGPPLILFNDLVIQIGCFYEIMNIAYNVKKIDDLPHFKALNWYLVFVANYFFFGAAFRNHIQVFLRKYYLVDLIMNYHKFIAFCMYCLGMAFFICLVSVRSIRKQFTLLAWTHFLIIILSLQCYMVFDNVFQGLIWFLVPFFLVVSNDIFSYMFGRVLGKTPLIDVSPNKTLEGFVFGAIATFLFGIMLTYCFCPIPYLTCPINYVERNGSIYMNTNCTPSYLYQLRTYQVGNISFVTYPFIFHALSMSCFASLIAPFGGFCASGFKRAFRIKDFADTIPGHGGLTDRFDCQFLMSTFVNVYVSTFVKTPSIVRIYEKILRMSDDNQVKFLKLLEEELLKGGMLNDP